MKADCKYIMLLLVVGVLLAGNAFAIDGNYAAPYGSQWDSRSQIASLPLETLVGALLVLLNVLAGAIITLRNRKRTR